MNGVCVVLAAGAGRRMGSSLPKVLHELGGVPSLLRILGAAEKAFGDEPKYIVCSEANVDSIRSVVERWKADVGSGTKTVFCVQRALLGTADAVRIAMEHLPTTFSGTIKILPGDAGLLRVSELRRLQQQCRRGEADVVLLTGRFSGAADKNPYGRVLKIPSNKSDGSKADVLGIVQAQDILSMRPNDVLKRRYLGEEYRFTREALLNITEFDGLVVAFDAGLLRRHLGLLRPNNAQGEFYLTDCVASMVEEGRRVFALPVEDSDWLLGFNDQATLRYMEGLLLASGDRQTGHE